MLNTLVNVFEKEIKYNDSSSLIVRYYNGLKKAFIKLNKESKSSSSGFEPAFELPELNEKLIEFFEVAKAEINELGEYKQKDLYLFDLMKNPGTQTTKTLASLIMVARAINHINKTGEKILIFTPSSGNKAIALRDAVERAILLGLADKSKLSIITLIPKSSSHKLRNNELSKNSELRSMNPIFVYNGEIAQDVKKVGQDFIEKYGESIKEKLGYKVWYSLDIRNYKVADALRAFYDYEFFPWDKFKKGKRIHAHAVSSAYGLLGYNFGRTVLREAGVNYNNKEDEPGYLLVQHSKTSDMVLNLLFNDFSKENFPKYHRDTDGLFRQNENNHFPLATWDYEENLESTFYTHTPPTSNEMNTIINKNGGSGIVVSLYECISQFGKIGGYLRELGINLPNDPRKLNEWSLIMAFTGVINAIDRNIISEFDSIVIHGSGLYTENSYEQVKTDHVFQIEDSTQLYNNYYSNMM